MTDQERAELSDAIGDIMAEHFAKFRADMLEKMIGLRSPRFELTPMGELYVDGAKAGDVRPVFKAVVSEVMDERFAKGSEK